ncbi:MAG: NADH:flavin oxidoreductase/NADH oxidase [Alphaproteobacteria bacterium]|nr:NADH:flavin oxidoreductase/NADH oxidase [Alphaproteobacteria bacterium]
MVTGPTPRLKGSMLETPALFQPLALRGVTLKNRIVVSPMCQYSALDGQINDWHRGHHTTLARGGVGLVIVEATAVEERGRITHGDTGLWNDDQVAGMAEIAAIIARHGATPGIQIGHAGRKASAQRPWEGNVALGQSDADRGDAPWQTVAPTAEPFMEGWHCPDELSDTEIVALVDAFAAAAARAHKAGFRMLEIHGAHGYLIHSFLSPISNRRNDRWGGDREGRMAFALAVTEAVRGQWPDDLPLFFRVSSVDHVEGGWQIEDTIALAVALHGLGVDAIDCSSGGVAGMVTAARVKRDQGFQVAYAEAVKRETPLASMAVGLILDPGHANAIVAEGRADLVALGRELLRNPFWPLQAAEALDFDPDYGQWPDPYGWWLDRRTKSGFNPL